MIIFPNAKINLGLNIIEKREDGFHNIESVFYPVALKDALELVENTEAGAQRFTFSSSGIEIPGDPMDNLCYYAYQLVAQDYAVPAVNVHLHKHIPIGAGLGGGSADAAFFIKLLNEKFELGISWGEMHHYARQLGSDCSFFVSNRPAFAEGRGDEYETLQLDLSKYHIALIYPRIHINTAKAYSGVKPKSAVRSLESDVQNLPLEKWKEYIHNDFEDSIFPQFPEIKNIKEKLYERGAVYAAMSGSGSTVYGIFESPTDLASAFKNSLVFESTMM